MSDSNYVPPQSAPFTKLRVPSRQRTRRLQREARQQRVLRRTAVRPSILPTEEQSGLEMVDIDSMTAIDLKKRFPISRRLVLKEMSPWIFGFSLLIWFYRHNFAPATTSAPLPSSQVDATIAYAAHTWQLYTIDEILLYSSAIAVLTVMGLYHELQRLFFQYKIEGFRLVIRKGIVLVEEGSLPLLPIAEVHARRNFFDLIFGLYQVHIAVPIDLVKSFARIEGLSKKNANLLIDFLSAQLSRQVAVPEQQRQIQMMGDFNNPE